MDLKLFAACRCLLGLFLGVFLASGVHAQSVTLSAVNNSLCFWSDTDNDQSSPVAYDPANLDCVENSGLNVIPHGSFIQIKTVPFKLFKFRIIFKLGVIMYSFEFGHEFVGVQCCV